MGKLSMKSLALVICLLAVMASAQAADKLAKFDKIAVGPTGFSTGVINLAPGTTAAKGIYFGNDVTLYRSAANTLKTDDSLTVTGTLTTGALSFTNATASGTWGVTGATTLTGALTANGNVTLGNAAGDTITVTGTATFAETVTCTGAATVGTTLGVTGATTLTGALVANGAVTLGDAVGDTITINGTPTFAENVAMSKTLAVTGAATLGSTLAVTGGATLSSTLAVTGATTLTGALVANGDATLGDAATDTVTTLGKLKLCVVADAGPMTATNGTEGMLVYNDTNDKVYVCTTTGTPATWAALH